MRLKKVSPLMALLTLLLFRTVFPDNSGATGLKWTVEGTDFDGANTSIAVDSNGYPRISYLEYISPTEVNLFFAYKDVLGWHIQTIDSSNNSSSATTSLVLDKNDYAHLCYRGGNNLKYAYQDATGWHIENVTSESGSQGDSCSIALDRNGYPHISYHDNLIYHPEKSLKYAFKDTAGWHIESAPEDGQYNVNGIALDSDGYPHIGYIIYNNAGSYSGRHAYKNAAGWHYEIFDPAGANSGGRTCIALNDSNYPQIIYLGVGALKFAYQDISGWHIETVVDKPVGYHLSMALDNKGYPHISYYDNPSYPYGDNTNLKYAYKDETGWHTATVDYSDYVGTHNAITLDKNGFPHLSYKDENNDRIKYAYASPMPALTINKAGTGSGTVTSNLPGINCGQTCSAQFEPGSVVNLTVIPAMGSTFDGWSGDADCSDGQLTMNADRNCVATFIWFGAYLPLIIIQ